MEMMLLCDCLPILSSGAGCCREEGYLYLCTCSASANFSENPGADCSGAGEEIQWEASGVHSSATYLTQAEEEPAYQAEATETEKVGGMKCAVA